MNKKYQLHHEREKEKNENRKKKKYNKKWDENDRARREFIYIYIYIYIYIITCWFFQLKTLSLFFIYKYLRFCDEFWDIKKNSKILEIMILVETWLKKIKGLYKIYEIRV